MVDADEVRVHVEHALEDGLDLRGRRQRPTARSAALDRQLTLLVHRDSVEGDWETVQQKPRRVGVDDALAEQRLRVERDETPRLRVEQVARGHLRRPEPDVEGGVDAVLASV